MSASTERKNRQYAVENGTHKKTLAQQKEEKKQKKDKVKWIIVTALIVVFFVFVFLVNSGVIFRSLTALTVTMPENAELGTGAISRSFSVAEVNCAYNMQYQQYQQMISSIYGENAQYYTGIDTSKSFKDQPCAMSEEEGYTWDDYFSDAAEQLLTQLAVFEEYSKVKGIVLDDEDYAAIDETIKSFDSAKDYGYGSPDKLVAGNYGKGANIKLLRSMLELQSLASKAQETVADSFTFTADEISAKYDSVKDTYDKLSYSYYEIKAKVAETGTDEETAPVPTDEAIAEAKATADSILAKMNDEELSLADAAKAVVADAEVKDDKDVQGASLNSELSKWLLDAERKAGDATTIKGSAGAYVVVFTSRDNNKHTTEESGDVNYCDYIGENLLRNEAYSKWSEEKLSVITDAAEYDRAFGMTYVGR